MEWYSCFDRGTGSTSESIIITEPVTKVIIGIIGNARTLYEEKVYTGLRRIIDEFKLKYHVKLVILLQQEICWGWQFPRFNPFFVEKVPREVYETAIAHISQGFDDVVVDWDMLYRSHSHWKSINLFSSFVTDEQFIVVLRPDVEYRGLVELVRTQNFLEPILYSAYDQGFMSRREIFQFWNNIERLTTKEYDQIRADLGRTGRHNFDIGLVRLELALHAPKNVQWKGIIYPYICRPFNLRIGITPHIFNETTVRQIINLFDTPLFKKVDGLPCSHSGLIGIVSTQKITRALPHPTWSTERSEFSTFVPYEGDNISVPYNKLLCLLKYTDHCQLVVHCLNEDHVQDFTEYLTTDVILFHQYFVCVPYKHLANYFYLLRFKDRPFVKFSDLYPPELQLCGHLNPDDYKFL